MIDLVYSKHTYPDCLRAELEAGAFPARKLVAIETGWKLPEDSAIPAPFTRVRVTNDTTDAEKAVVDRAVGAHEEFEIVTTEER